MTTTLASATQTEPNVLAILVDTTHASALHRFLLQNGITCGVPSEAIFRTLRVYVDGAGRSQVEDEAIVHEIRAQGTIDDFPRLMSAWILQME